MNNITSKKDPPNNLCRICLTENTSMKIFSEKLHKEAEVTILGAMQEVMQYEFKSETLQLICTICNGLLGIAYDLVKQFHESTSKLEQWACYNMLPLNKSEENIENDNLKVVTDAAFDPPAEENKIAENELTFPDDNLNEDFSDSSDKPISELIHKSKTVKKTRKKVKPIVKIKKDKKKNAKEDKTKVAKPPRKRGVIHTCEHCQNSYNSKGTYVNHLRVCVESETDNTSISKSICPYCQDNFPTMKELADHVRKSHPDEKQNYFCTKCDYVSVSRGSYKYHLLTHEERKYQCDKCPKKFFTNHQLKLHLDTHTQKTVNLCPVCGKSFNYIAGLESHMRCHNNDKRFVCKFCNRRFANLNTLKRHVRTHTGIKPYPCSYCDKKLASVSEKKLHEMVHTGERQFHCGHCDKGFIAKTNYRHHLMTHPGPYACLYCVKTFVDNDSVRLHVKTKHSIKEANIPFN